VAHEIDILAGMMQQGPAAALDDPEVSSRLPMCGALSVGMFALTVVLFDIAYRQGTANGGKPAPPGQWDPGAPLAAFTLAMALVGAALGVVALARRERLPLFAIGGILLNGLYLLCGIGFLVVAYGLMSQVK
jgi:hypothetical protein